MRIGVISDTHDFLDPRVPELFAGVAHILHGGDVGMPRLLLQLQQIAPVTAVLGNTDSVPQCGIQLTEVVELAGRKFFLHHVLNPHLPGDDLKSRLARERPDVVVFGHTHRPFCERIGDTLFFNPGYAGKPKFGLARSVAILHCDAKEIRTEFLNMP